MRPLYIAQIARFTLQEAVSRRLILAGVAISLAYIGLFALGFQFAFDRSVNSGNISAQGRAGVGVAFAALTLFGVYVVNYLASFLALFLSVGAISGEIDSGTLHAVLARPIARAEYVVGRWLGYSILLGAYVLAMTQLVLLVARLIADFEVPEPGLAMLLMLLECVLLLTLSLLGSTLMPTLANGVVVFTLLALAWLGGILEFVGNVMAMTAESAAASEALITIGTIVSLLLPSDALWHGASYFLAPPLLLSAMSGQRVGIPFFSSEPPAPALIVWSLIYVCLVLAATIVSFRRRDL